MLITRFLVVVVLSIVYVGLGLSFQYSAEASSSPSEMASVSSPDSRFDGSSVDEISSEAMLFLRIPEASAMPSPTPDLTVDFGNQNVGSSSDPFIIPMINTTGTEIVLATPTLTNGTQFQILGTPNGTVVPQGEQFEIGVMFSPTSAGPKSDTLTINTSIGPVATILLTGVGVETLCAWSPAADYPVSTFNHAGAVQGAFLYSFGGRADNVPTAASYKFDGTMWTPIAPLPEPRWGATAVTDGGYIYIIGGVGTDLVPLDTGLRYDPAAQTYSPIAAMPLPRAFHSAAYLNFVHGKINVWGGTHDGTGPASSSHVAYDIASNSWSSAASMPVPAAYATSFVDGLYIYSVGGAADYIEATPMATALRYDPAADQWSDAAMADLPQPLMGAVGSTRAFQGRLWMVGGSFIGVVSWDRTANAWNSMPPTMYTHGTGVGGVINDIFYVSSSNQTEKYTCTAGPTPTPTPTPALTVDFGNQNVGSSSGPFIIPMINTTGTEITLGTPTFAEGTQFGLLGTPNGTVVPQGEQFEVVVEFYPTSVGPKSDTLTINTSIGPVATILLKGVGVEPTPTPTPTPDVTLDFGNQIVGSSSDQLQFVIINTIGTEILVGTPTFADGTQFQLLGNPSGTVVPQEGTFGILLMFSPTSAGPKSDILTIHTNFGPMLTILLTGVGIDPVPTPTPTPTPTGNRIISFVGGTAPAGGGQVATSVQIAAQGDENGVGFSLNYDTALLANPVVSLGSGFPDAALFVNTDEIGKIGVVFAVPANTTIPTGVHDLVTITFDTFATSAANTQVTMGDDPTFREVSDTNADTLPADFVGGFITFSQGYEADVAPRPTGNGAVSITDLTQVGRFTAGLDTFDNAYNEFQRADSAPRSTFGNGLISVADYTQAGRYAAGLDTLAIAAGPSGTSVSPSGSLAASPLDKADDVSGLVTPVQVVSTQAGPGTQVVVSITAAAQGTENGFGFSLEYDPNILQNPVVARGADAQAANLIPNTDHLGKVGVILAYPTGTAITAGTKQLVTVTFNVAPGAPGGPTPITFSDDPVIREISNPQAGIVKSEYIGGSVTILAPTAANVSVSGRVMSQDGLGIYNVRLTLLSADGTQRTAISNSFGYFRFEEVGVGSSYVLDARSKLHQFQPQLVVVNDQIDDLVITALPNLRSGNASGPIFLGSKGP